MRPQVGRHFSSHWERYLIFTDRLSEYTVIQKKICRTTTLNNEKNVKQVNTDFWCQKKKNRGYYLNLESQQIKESNRKKNLKIKKKL